LPQALSSAPKNKRTMTLIIFKTLGVHSSVIQHSFASHNIQKYAPYK
jgi:hypothetical protein